MTRASLALSACLTLAATPALAGQAPCWFENGVVVVGAEVMGVPGDYILDTATPHTQLAETQAQAAGFAETALTGEVRLAGVALAARPVSVADLDLRTGALPTPIAGVIGADVLKAYVLDLSFAPCRVVLWRPGEAPPFVVERSLPLYPGVRHHDGIAYAVASGTPLTRSPHHWTDGCPVVESRPGPGPGIVTRTYLDPSTGAALLVEAVPRGAPRASEVRPGHWG